MNVQIHFMRGDSAVLAFIKAQNNGRSAVYRREGERLSLPPCDPVSHFWAVRLASASVPPIDQSVAQSNARSGQKTSARAATTPFSVPPHHPLRPLTDGRHPSELVRFNLPLRPSCHVQDIFDVLISFPRTVFGDVKQKGRGEGVVLCDGRYVFLLPGLGAEKMGNLKDTFFHTCLGRGVFNWYDYRSEMS